MKNTTNTDNNTSILLSNGRRVHREFFDYVCDVITVRTPSLIPNTTYELKQIFGDYFWDFFDNGERSRAGKCMVHLVEKGTLPFISVNICRHQSPKKYQLK